MIRFYGHHTFFLNPEPDHFPKKNVLQQFKLTDSQPIVSVTPYQNDRGFLFRFEDVSALHIQCFGRRSAMYLVKDNVVIDSFKDLHPKEGFETPSTDLDFHSDMNTFEEANRFLTKDLIEELDRRDFFSASNPHQAWNDFFSDFNNQPVYINRGENEAPKLSIRKSEHSLESYTDLISAFHDFGRLLLAYSRQHSLKQQLLQETNKALSQYQKREKKLVKALDKLEKRPDFKQIGDVLMANIYTIESNLTEVELDNFYTGRKIKITLKRDLNPQKNAERYYQKSKNAHLEVNHTRKQLMDVRQKMEELEEKLTTIEKAEGHKELQQLVKQSNTKEPSLKEIKQLPYKRFTYQEFEIWVGKSAKANDELLKLAHKNDTWFHARGVAGSHVLLKNPEAKAVSEPVLEYAASLAAKYSKSQNDGLAAVIYTSPKFVRKFKGALPGQVRVDREEVILVEPAG
jgi:predicted ribosome quality control (RQC) complex YloA/Tae2 family protein